MEKFFGEFFCNGLIFSILVVVVIFMTRTKKNADKCSFRTCWQSLFMDLKADEMNRLKGFILLLVAVAVGGTIKAMEIGPLWLRESFAQCTYMFGSAVAAVFMRSGYEAAAHKDEK